ncbi:hypothetical protein ABFS82_08G085000 [Erythranthe guttata]
MASPSHHKTLLQVLQELTVCRSAASDLSPYEIETIPWTESHISAVIDYVSELENAKCFDFSAWSYTSIPSLGEDKSCKLPSAKIVAAFFTQELRQLFQLPNLQKKNELVATFINFLVRLLYHRTNLMKFFDDEINILTRELRFFVTILGDTPFIEFEQVHDLLEEFEAVANDAAGLVYSFIFLPECMVGIHKPLDALFKRIEILKANIIKFLNLLPFITTDEFILGDASVDSLFIVDSLLYDLEELMNRNDGPIVSLKDQIRILHQQLMLSRSLLKSIKVPPHDSSGIQESRALIRHSAYEAEYLINCFSVGDAPRWYVTMRLTYIIQTNELILVYRAIHILDRLVGGRDQLQLISIFGMPGLGKTTFAKKMYNHPLVNDRFDRCSWCVVSQMYQRKRLLADILIGLSSEFDKDMILSMDEEMLVVRIYQGLKGRRYLIVMDDIWDLKAWDNVLRCFPDDGNGSRILFTNRNKDVAPPNSLIYPLPTLSNDQCWKLLEKKVFHDEPCPLELKGIGRQIAENCHGLPLAVVFLAGTLSTMDRQENTWKEVGNGVGSYLFDGGDNSAMQKILELSYRHLPEYLKPCFLYFGVFVQYRKNHVRKLIRLWIAEGFIHKGEGKSAESTGEEYLTELIDKSLVIVSKRRSNGGVKTCMIRDEVYEFCRNISEQENFLKVAIVRNDYPIYLTGPFGWHARSFHCLPMEKKIYFGNMVQLRVLDFDLHPPRSMIGLEYLVQLRYLEITDLPGSIGSLVNLECVIVTNKTEVVIPLVVLEMKRLKYILLTYVSFFNQYIDCPENNNNIQFLRNVGIYGLNDEEILKCSPHLRKLKCECEPYYDKEKGAYRYPDFRFFTELESLNLKCVNMYRKWVGISLLPGIRKLVLSDLCLTWEMLSVIGRLQKLEVFKLRCTAVEERIWETREGEFQELRVLKLEGLELAEWNVGSSEHFPKLQQLVLRDCTELKEIPCDVGEIVTLQLIEVRGFCEKSLVKSAIKIKDEQRDIGNEEFRVVIAHIRRPWRPL